MIAEQPLATRQREHREQLENISRSLTNLSRSAAFFALQAKNDHVEVVVEGFSEITELLAACKGHLRKQ